MIKIAQNGSTAPRAYSVLVKVDYKLRHTSQDRPRVDVRAV